MHTWRIGDVTVTKIVELEITGGTRFVLPQATREACRPIDWMKPQTRHDVFSALAGTSTLLIGTHFAGATAGRVVRDGERYRPVA